MSINHRICKSFELLHFTADKNGDENYPLSIRRPCHRSISKSSWHVSSTRLCRHNTLMLIFLATGSSGRRNVSLCYLLINHLQIFSSQRSEDRKRRWRRQYESLQDARALQNGHNIRMGTWRRKSTSWWRRRIGTEYERGIWPWVEFSYAGNILVIIILTTRLQNKTKGDVVV